MEIKIGMALQEDGFVRVYDENGSYLFSISGELLVGYLRFHLLLLIPFYNRKYYFATTKMVRAKGLEPSRFKALASKTNVSTIPPRPHRKYYSKT